MPLVSRTHRHIIGVDTHARKHVYAVVAANGELLDTRDFPTSLKGIGRAVAWVQRTTDNDDDLLWVIEGVASYGAVLATHVTRIGDKVVEAPRMDAKVRHGTGKSDPLDAARIGMAVLSIDATQLRTPRRNTGTRTSLRVLIAARDDLSVERTAKVNALTALLRVYELGVDARRILSHTSISQVANWRARDEEISLRTARHEAVRLARRIHVLDEELAENKTKLTEFIAVSEACPLLGEKGIGPVTLAICLAAWSHKGRIRSSAAFCSLAGVNPIPASSGNTVRYRLNRGGDRRLNQALHMAVVCRMTYDARTREYVEKRRGEGKTDREIRRCLKRYLARHIYRTLESGMNLPERS